ncbi:MAG TPA: hypothetical protein VKY15_05220 [Acidimicrobiales bacterium]|nr:hypothetical protein [Acidimicrobiales bacterium]
MRTADPARPTRARDRRLSLGRFGPGQARLGRAPARAALEWLRAQLAWERTLEALRARRAGAAAPGQAA